MAQATTERVTVRGADHPDAERVLTPTALDFLRNLHDAFDARRRELLRARDDRQARITAGEMPDFLELTAPVRDGDWRVADAPADLRKRIVEITGPVERKMMINALNSGADVFMADFEDQLAAEKKCGHMGGKVLVPTSQFIRVLSAARLAADVLDVPTVLFARTDAETATLLTNDIDERDHEFLTGERTGEGYFRVRGGLDAAIARALAYAPYADVLWCETKTPDLDEARRFAEAVHEQYPGKLLAYNCSPSFNWKRHLDDETIAKFQQELGAMGYRYQFITLAGWHLINLGAFEMAREYVARDMEAYVRLQEREFHLAEKGYTAVKHQREVGGNYFDLVLDTLSHGEASTGAMKESTETAQFG